MKNDDRRDDDKQKVSRRGFLGQASCAAVGTTALFNTALSMDMFNTLAMPCGDPDDYRALVCIFLSGGCDSFNVVVPSGDAEYQEYAGTRADLALPQEDLLPITPATSDGREYGLHPNMTEVHELFNRGKAAILSNVGTLVEPTTLQQFRDRSVVLPVGLFSHSDQIMHWQSSVPDERSAVGWAGRMADILEEGNCNENIAMNISLSGNNIFQTGATTAHYSIGPNGSRGLTDYGEENLNAMVRTEAIDGLLGLTYQNLFEKTYARRMRRAIDAHLEFSAATEDGFSQRLNWSPNGLSQRLRMIALTIAARQQLGMKRQTFFVQVGGWDHHDEVLNSQANMLPVLSRAIGEFQFALETFGIDDKVTTFTASDFGRTLSSNGRGSDHAWGGNHLIVGGAVNGGDMYGTYPSLYLGNPVDTGRGRLIPSTSVDQYFAELALWFGVPAADLELVLPNIARFYSPGSSSSPLGFLGGAPAKAVRTGRRRS